MFIYFFFKKRRWYQWKICHWNCIILRWNGHFDVGIDLVVRLLRTMKLSKRHKNIWLRNLYYAKCLFQLLKDFDHRYRTSWRRQPWNCPKAKWQFLPSFFPTFLLAAFASNQYHTYIQKFVSGVSPIFFCKNLHKNACINGYVSIVNSVEIFGTF